MNKTTRRPPAKTLYAYAYQIVPPQAEHRLRSIKTILNREHSEAKRGTRTWEGRFVLEQQVTHILVVSDSPDQDRKVNRSVNAALKELNTRFAVTASMVVVDDQAPDAI